MEDCDINAFLPAFPSIDLRGDNLFELFPSGFYNSLYSKEEFYQLQYDPNRPKIADGEFHPQSQQVYGSRYASAYTLYENQLIFQSMGVGKTALAILTIENNLGKGFVGGIIAVPSKKFIGTFITEIIKITGTKYLPEKHHDLTRDELKAAIRKNIKKVYKFITFEAFANSIEKDKKAGGSTAERLKNEYSNRVIIVDEAHNLRIQPDKKAATSRVNSAFFLLFHSIYNCKILLMTGTPMKDRWNELPDLMNLILPSDRQLPSGDAFDREYPNDGKEIAHVDKLKSTLRGLISTLRTIPSDVRKEYIGSILPGLELFKIDVCQMSDFQAHYYNEAYKIDTTAGMKEGIYDASLQAINFVFPDGSYGKEGFNKYTIPLKKPAKRLKKGERTFDIPKITPELRQAIEGKTHEETLQNLSKYSMKYATTIRNILYQADHKNGNTFVYNTFVKGSGVIIFARILELFGYSRSVTGIETTPGKRYALLTNLTLDEQGRIVTDLQKTFNDPKNAQGDYIQVIIGSRTSAEGLSFYNVEDIGIHTPYWNYSTIDQAIGRGIRYRSHEAIEAIYAARGIPFSVKIHHYASVSANPLESIDIMMYQRSQDKDIRIKLGERMLKEISYDCGNNRSVNMRGVDNSRECEYLECEYKCEGLASYEVKDPDFSTYNYYYSRDDEIKIISQVKLLFRTVFTLTLTDLFDHLSQYHHFVVIKSLKKMIDEAIIIINRLGFKSYLREFNDIYFLVDSMNKPTSSLASYYTSAPAVKQALPFATYIEKLQFRQSGKLLDLIYTDSLKNDYAAVLNYVNMLPPLVKENLLETVLSVEGKLDGPQAEFRRWFIDINKANIHKLSTGRYASTLLEGTIMCQTAEDTWIDCTDDEKVQTDIDASKAKIVTDLEDNPYGYYGIVNLELKEKDDTWWKNAFWIRDVKRAKEAKLKSGKQMQIKGQKCSTQGYEVGRLASIIYLMDASLNLENGIDQKETLNNMRAKLLNDKFITHDKINVAELSEADVRRLYRLYKGKAQNLCKLLYKFFEEHQLLQFTGKTDMKT